jgi:hypothetical protein
VIGLCFRYDRRRPLRELWEWNISSFGVDKVWERGRPPDFQSHHPVTSIQTADELPRDPPLVVFQPPEGRHVQGAISLYSFEHPEDAIYFFGTDDENMTLEADLGSRRDFQAVYIPTVKYELFGAIAGAIALFDRASKRGRNG